MPARDLIGVPTPSAARALSPYSVLVEWTPLADVNNPVDRYDVMNLALVKYPLPPSAPLHWLEESNSAHCCNLGAYKCWPSIASWLLCTEGWQLLHYSGSHAFHTVQCQYKSVPRRSKQLLCHRLIPSVNPSVNLQFPSSSFHSIQIPSGSSVNVRTLQAPPLNQPAPVVEALGSNIIRVVWSEPRHPNGIVTNYSVYRRLAGGSGNAYLVYLSNGNSTFTFTNAGPGNQSSLTLLELLHLWVME